MGLLTAGRRGVASLSKQAVKIVEVGPRDGLQNEPRVVPTAVKLAFIERLAASGLTTIEATSFVSPKWVPQMADARQVVEGLLASRRLGECRFPVLIPNLRGFDDFYACTEGKMGEIAVFVAASESFSQKNTNCSIATSLERMRAVTAAAATRGVRVRGYVSCVVKCPYEGRIAPEAVLQVTGQLLELGCYEVSLGDTTGAGTAGDVERLLSHLVTRVPVAQLAIHCHDTYGQSLANIHRALEMGVRTVDASCAGLGGCPYAPGASGNVATEDLVYMLQGDGRWDCGVDLDRLLDAGEFISAALQRPSGSKVAQALRGQKQRTNAG